MQTLPLVLVLMLSASSAFGVIFSGAGGRGVPVNSSSLISTLDYSDTFTGTTDGSSNPSRPYVPAIQPAAAYVVENSYGNPSANFQTQGVGPGQAAFSFAADGPGTPGLVDGAPGYPGTSGAGSATGFTQTGGSVDYGVPYALRTRYLVQVDAVASSDRIDITSAPLPGSIFQANSLSIFFRGDGSGNASLYNGATDTPIRDFVPNFNTGLPNDGQWHNYAVLFDQTASTVELFVDEASKGVIDLTTFAGGLYQGFSNGAVGAGGGTGAGQNRIWTDNFQVGAPIPEPGAIALLGFGLLLSQRRRRG
ncbi:MAG: PEP-CTERM sorting domain-containing protein [Verrucomicrobiales bacterium]